MSFKSKSSVIIKPLSGWEAAIEKAMAELEKAEKRALLAKAQVVRLRAAIRTFEENRNTGEPFPC